MNIIASYLAEHAGTGATVALADAHAPQSGYAVGRPPYGTVFGPGTGRFPTRLATRIAEWLDTLPTDVQYVGIWRDDRTGRVHVDAVDVFANRSDAHGASHRRGELAYFDLAAGEETRLQP